MKYLYFTAFGLFLFAYRHLDHITRRDPILWYIPFIEEMSSAYVIGFTVPWIMAMARRGSSYVEHFGAAIGIGAVQTTGFYIVRLAVFGLLGLGIYDYGILWIRYFMELPMQLIIYGVIAGGTISWDDRRRAAQLELENLRLQLQPHFLFNTLNMISSVVYESPAKADEMLCRLSEYLRDALAQHPTQEVPLNDEISVAKAYLAIMEARFENGLQIDWQVDEGIGNAVVPYFLLQPLAENSLRHGLSAIRAFREGDSLIIALDDLGIQTGDGAGMGIGLGNTRKRLARLYGSRGTIDLAPHSGTGTTVKVKLPYKAAV